MPTLTSLRVHPDLRERLLRQEPTIKSPQALLSRDPLSLAQSMGVPLDELLRVRSDVAEAVVSQEIQGERSIQVHETLNQYPASYQQDEDFPSVTTLNSPSPSLIPNSVSLRDLCLYESIRGDHYHNLSTGSHQLDKLLAFPSDYFSLAIQHPERTNNMGWSDDARDGGIPFGYVTQVVGPSASGKTQLALVAAANHAAKHKGMSVYYLASGVGQGALVQLAIRVKNICKNNSNGDQVLQGVSFITVSNAHEVLVTLSEIESKELCSSQDNLLSSPTPVLVVLDSASGCLSGDLYAAGDRGPAVSLVREVAIVLKRMSRQYGAAVLVTNGTVSSKDNGNSVKAAMGQYWSVADMNLWFETTNDTDWKDHEKTPGLSLSRRRTICATLESHPAKPCHDNNIDLRTVNFDVTAAGIVDAL